MKRSEAREHVFKLLYEMQFQQEEQIEELVDTYLENFSEKAVTENDRSFILREVKGVAQTRESLDEEIAGAVKGWSLSRLSKVDLAILRLAVYEIHCAEEIPASVSINEAVELAKKYSQSAARAFINGILGSIAPREEED
ncbi:MAG: transcription antitermination factor NusB [Lachnospiraceae bacterium]|jgi:N utilization substance protein B|nr:transcription antitermination factor NusB [Lachnospiraceae bacterium]